MFGEIGEAAAAIRRATAEMADAIAHWIRPTSAPSIPDLTAHGLLDLVDEVDESARAWARLAKAVEDAPAHDLRCGACGQVGHRHRPGHSGKRIAAVCPVHGPLVDVTPGEFLARARRSRSSKLPPQTPV